VNDAAIRYERNVRWLKRWIWVYFWLLIFEGALRKWAVPSLSGPLLLVRDPVAVILYLQAYRCGKFTMRKMWPLALLAVALIWLSCAQIAAGIDTPAIAAFGLRSYLLHLPLIFVIADVLDEHDLHAIGRWLLLLMIPMTLLVLAEFEAPPGAWINAGAGKGAEQIIATGNHIRPAGTFSFNVGMQGFTMLVAAYAVDALMRKGVYRRWLTYPAMLALVASVPMQCSRTTLFTLILLVILALFSGIAGPRQLVGIVKITGVLMLTGVILLQFSVIQAAVSTFEKRWKQAQQSEGDVQQVLDLRVLGTFEGGLEAAGTTPLLGEGIGMGSNYAAVATTGEPSFLLGESEWERVIPEMGPVCGLLFMASRVAFAVYLVLKARQALSRGSVLAWLLLPGCVPLVIMGIMEQATFLGFMVFSSGLCLAAARPKDAPTSPVVLDAIGVEA
jgi:hypothetical protein